MDQLISIYIPTRNRGVLLERAVRSVLRQTHSNLELIVVNDGSTDQTMSFLDQLKQDDPRVIPIHMRTSVGPSAARNVAIKMASGALVTGLDDDDEFASNRIEAFLGLWNALEGTPSVFSCLFAQSIFVTHGQEWLTNDRKDHVQFEDLFHHNYIGNQVFTTKERLIEVGLFDENLNAWEDLDLFIRLVQKFGEARLLNAPTYICDVAQDRERISRSEPRIRRSFELILQKYPDLPKPLRQRLFLQMFSDYHGIRPSIDDLRRCFRWGFNINVAFELLKPNVKAHLRSLRRKSSANAR